VKPIAITLGDPAGIGSEVVFKALAELDPTVPVALFGDWNYASQAPGFLSKIPRISRSEPARVSEHTRSFVDLDLSDSATVQFGKVEAEYGRISLAAIEAALQAIEQGICGALVTAPIHKKAIADAGASVAGHTELLAARSGRRRYAHDHAMYFDSPSLKVALLSVHEPLIDAIRRITAENIVALAALTRREIQRLYDLDPRIGVAGVNPHAGEEGMFGNEERAIEQAVEQARSSGLQISGPQSPDMVFYSARQGAFDVVLAMYHDQGLIPVKTLEFDRSVNVTIGLPFLRSSVDHGTAFDIAGKGIANHRPMLYAIEWTAIHMEKFAG
jgi:4-hydroxythreonine-4-phosphate dehydrogenase